MTNGVLKMAGALALAGVISACASGGGNNWYEDRCIRVGFAIGTADFDQCIARDKKWVEDTRRRAARQNHP